MWNVTITLGHNFIYIYLGSVFKANIRKDLSSKVSEAQVCECVAFISTGSKL